MRAGKPGGGRPSPGGRPFAGSGGCVGVWVCGCVVVVGVSGCERRGVIVGGARVGVICGHTRAPGAVISRDGYSG